MREIVLITLNDEGGDPLFLDSDSIEAMGPYGDEHTYIMTRSRRQYIVVETPQRIVEKINELVG